MRGTPLHPAATTALAGIAHGGFKEFSGQIHPRPRQFFHQIARFFIDRQLAGNIVRMRLVHPFFFRFQPGFNLCHHGLGFMFFARGKRATGKQFLNALAQVVLLHMVQFLECLCHFHLTAGEGFNHFFHERKIGKISLNFVFARFEITIRHFCKKCCEKYGIIAVMLHQLLPDGLRRQARRGFAGSIQRHHFLTEGFFSSAVNRTGRAFLNAPQLAEIISEMFYRKPRMFTKALNTRGERPDRVMKILDARAHIAFFEANAPLGFECGDTFIFPMHQGEDCALRFWSHCHTTVSNTGAYTMPAPAPPLAIYLHWPFCKKKCPYCDFNSHVREQVDTALWQRALLAELQYWAPLTAHHRVTSMFFGGGTPSLMPPELVAALIEAVRKNWRVADAMEITLEANPTSVEAANFEVLAQAGVNRLSLGVQSLKPGALKFLGREHSADDARRAIALAARHFPRYSFDLIYALPGQTRAAWEAELREALTLSRGHLSLYQLTIEENTAFHHAYHHDHAFELPEESLAAALYERTQRVMEEAGLPAYEISNHAAAGQESRHNLSYWRGEAYLGIGPGAHGRVDVAGDARLATRNLKSPERWLEQALRLGQGLEEQTVLDAATRAEEKLLMGLRLTREGVNLSRLQEDEREVLRERFTPEKLEKLTQAGLITYRGDRLLVTPPGALLLNAVTAALLA